jgi:ribosomal-protein-alanine N-acetyltransferase
MPYVLAPMSEEDAREVSGWRYPAPYHVYKWPRWDVMQARGREFADPAVRAAQYLTIRDNEDRLTGYLQLFPLDRVTRLGLGLHPDLCGRGLGHEVVRLAVEEACKRRPGAEVDLEVETWNVRAVKAYQKAGFVAEDEYERLAEHGVVRVLCMVWRPAGGEA